MKLRGASPNDPLLTQQARRILDLEIQSPVNEFGGYGPEGEVIYSKSLRGCPGVFMDEKGGHTLSVQSNGSTEFKTHAEGKEIFVLRGSFDPVLKREKGVPSQNLWFRTEEGQVQSLINPVLRQTGEHRVVKTPTPDRSIWFTYRSETLGSAVKLTLRNTACGPVLVRECLLFNRGQTPLKGQLWSCFHLHGTQFFSYNKDNWYDTGLPLSTHETVVACPVPFTSISQIKRLSSQWSGLEPLGATCDYESFVGDCGASALFPQAVLEGHILPQGAGERLNRFSTPTLAAGGFAVDLKPGDCAILRQTLLYIEDAKLVAAFRELASTDDPSYQASMAAFKSAAASLAEATDSAIQATAEQPGEQAPAANAGFHLECEAFPAVAEYANSLWATVFELYENCRAHGAKLADGIEIGMRDRAQDMWVKVRQDPARVRTDLVHALSLMIWTSPEEPKPGTRMTLVEKLHGTFPRQYPSRWLDRTQAVANDNRPYADSSLWLLNALCRYIKQTGDSSILGEPVPGVELITPDDPVNSSMRGRPSMSTIAAVVAAVFENLRRSMDDSPYGMIQVLYGDWCDPVDMFGSREVGNPATRGQGRGVNARLSAHAVETIIETLDILEIPALADCPWIKAIRPNIERAKETANRLRKNTLRWAWEGDNFVDSIHEYRVDGSVPNSAAGESGYTFGSAYGRDFDGMNRHVATANAYGLKMLILERGYLEPVSGVSSMVEAILKNADAAWDKQRGLPLVDTPVPNNALALKCVGRMGMLPPGTAENGEYHHGQIFMHSFRSLVPGELENSFRRLAPVLSVNRHDGSLGGPFDSPANSYACDRDDPHFGMGMNFGLSGSTAWLIEYFERLAGLEVDLSDPTAPHLRVTHPLPSFLQGSLDYKREVYVCGADGTFKCIPVTLQHREGKVFLNHIECQPGTKIPLGLLTD